MDGVERGLYEVLISEALAARLQNLGDRLLPERTELRAAEAADRIALHIGRVVQRAIQDVPVETRVTDGITLARRLVEHIAVALANDASLGERPIEPAALLRAMLAKRPDGTPEAIPEPLIPLLDTALLTNAPNEPRIGSQLLAEIASADRIEVVMAFIRRSGIAPLLEALRRHCDAHRPLRILTTTYTGSTEARALDELQRIGAELRVSYDTTSTRLHAKAWLFHRNSSFSTAYVGSSNLTHSAQVDGLEWNVRVSGARNPDVIGKVGLMFEAYWNNRDFLPYDAAEFAQRVASQGAIATSVALPPTELRLEPFQERLLEQIELSREAGHHRNLLAAATGTGKTVMAAVDYARLRHRMGRARLLFVAHREEILLQSRATFCHALRDAAFGELWVGGERPTRFEHVFASIQSLAANSLDHLDPRHFDIVVVDEFHHAAAVSYQRLLDRLQPVELLGLTATPERSDGLPILHWFGDRIAAELRLWDAIDQQRLVPFLYYGIADETDLRAVPWRRGHGYDTTALSNVLTANDALGNLVVEQVARHVDDPRRMRTLGFCVSIVHARFMARVFSAAGIPSVAVWSDTPEGERRQALQDLAARRVNVVFSVDLFNEGVDVPAVDTVLFLRPTDSPTLFLQQLGRGLRKSHGKSTCTVLDFVGQHRREFRYDRRFRALLGGSRKDLEQQIENGFPFLPAGCHLQLDAVAKDRVLDSVRSALPSEWRAKAAELRQLAASGNPVSLARFLDESGLELGDVYSSNHSWSELREAAGLPVAAPGEHERVLRRACGRLLHVDDRERIAVWRDWLLGTGDANWPHRPARHQKTLRMLLANVFDTVPGPNPTVLEAQAMLRKHPQVCSELLELLTVLEDRIGHVHPAAQLPPQTPLHVHARYTRVEILAALDVGDGTRTPDWREGVKWVPTVGLDLFAFTLDKTSGQFSPTTSYKDRAISRELIQWESQSVTRADSDTGLRYQQHVAMGTRILLFARLRADDRAFWFLGPATYVKHEGERPMSITWKLDHALPGDLYLQFAAAVA